MHNIHIMQHNTHTPGPGLGGTCTERSLCGAGWWGPSWGSDRRRPAGRCRGWTGIASAEPGSPPGHRCSRVPAALHIFPGLRCFQGCIWREREEILYESITIYNKEIKQIINNTTTYTCYQIMKEKKKGSQFCSWKYLSVPLPQL